MDTRFSKTSLLNIPHLPSAAEMGAVSFSSSPPVFRKMVAIRRRFTLPVRSVPGTVLVVRRSVKLSEVRQLSDVAGNLRAVAGAELKMPSFSTPCRSVCSVQLSFEPFPF